MFTRRNFIGGIASLGAAGMCGHAAGNVTSGGKPLARLGVISDIHIHGLTPNWRAAFLKALRFFRDRGADGVVVAGDMADNGRIDQLQAVAEDWFSVFPDGKGPDGRKVEQLFVYGNHDASVWGPAADKMKTDPEFAATRLCRDAATKAKTWEDCFHEEYKPIWMKNVNGITVVGAHWQDHLRIEDYMKEHGREIDPRLPFFYVQHAHPKDTCFGAWAWGHDNGASTRALSSFPNAVALSGHSHYSLTDERTVWQGAFTSINTGSLRYSSHDYSMRENACNFNGFGYKGETRKHVMKQLATGDGKHGMLFSVFADRIEIERRDFESDCLPLGDDWIVPIPAAADGPMSYARRAAKRSAPEFADGAEVKVRPAEGKDGVKCMEVSFPAAQPVDGCRVNEYEVTATLVEDDFDLVQAQRRVLAPGFNLPLKNSAKPGSCLFSRDELPKGHYVFSVRPIECFGRKGKAIASAICRMLSFFVVLFAACAAQAALRPPAVPLVAVEPHFSVWSAADRLYDRDTTHWSGAAQPLSIFLDADGATYRLCGCTRFGRDATLEIPVLPQTSCRVGATTTSYRFENGRGLSAEVDFTTPHMTDDLDVFSRPVTYLTVRVSGAREHSVRVSITGAWATNDDKAKMAWTTNEVAGVRDVSVGRAEQTPFSIRGDRKRADWGYVHLVGPLTTNHSALTTTFLLAYDNVKSVRFFGENLVDWWARGGKTFSAMLAEAVADAPRLEAKCREFDAQFRADMEKVGGVKYADIAELSWRQSFAACKFVAGPGGEPFMFSAENASGGMIGTTDVFYPQFPHLLYSSLTLAKASLAPTCIYAASTNWPYAYAPHDLGLFPVAEGQYYGMKKGQAVGGGADDTFRMPVEECGNMLILLAAVAKAEGNAGFASRWWDEVAKWAEYLSQFGYDPGSQLCTDDFAGHLAHNANLSAKSIVALASYAEMAKMRGDAETAAKYRALAEEMVPKWIDAARGGAHGGTRIAFDRPGTWSQKYNIAWDRVLGFGLFPSEIAAAELKAYRAVAQPYGVPLDCRKTYTKADWIVWSGTLTGRREDLEFVCEGLHRFLDETPDRIPFSDWYMADSGLYRMFIARSVVGGVFMPVVGEKEK